MQENIKARQNNFTTVTHLIGIIIGIFEQNIIF